jgi:hypothetical protein
MEYIPIHFGEHCNPWIIINLLLKRHQLAVYKFNTIVTILEDENLTN